MKHILLFALITIINWQASAQIHHKKMLLFTTDHTAPILNVYDIKKEELLKSINTKEPIVFTSFNADETKLYAVGKKYVNIVDVNTLDLQKIQLLSDADDTTMFGSGVGNITMAQMTFPLGISNKGLIAYTRTQIGLPDKKMLYWLFDIHSGKKEFTTLVEGLRAAFYDNNFFIAEQDGSIRVVDAKTGQYIKTLTGAFDAQAIAEARKNARPGDNHISLEVKSWYGYLLTSVYHGVPGLNNTVTAGVYDIKAGKLIYKETINDIAGIAKVLPVPGSGESIPLFQRVEPLDPNKKAPELPVMPPSPDFSKMKPKEMTKALEAYQAETSAYTTKVGEWKVKFQEWNNPKNMRTRIYSDVGCTQEVLAVDGTMYAALYGDLLTVGKESQIEIYDVRTKKLMYTIYLV